MRYDRSVQDGNVISLPGRPDARMASQPAEREPALRHPQALHALAKALDALLVAQFELCGLDPHPTRASLSETRFRQAREALEDGIAQVKQLVAGGALPAAADCPPTFDPTAPLEPAARQDEIYAAD